MRHIYESIQGFFDFANIYSEAVDEVTGPAHFVEIGSWYGRSAAYMAVEIINSGKDIRFDVIDTWEGTWPRQGTEKTDPNLLKYGTMYPNFLTNVWPVIHAMTPIKLPSMEAVKLYPDHSLEFVFIDAAHDYENVKKDIIAWRPKVKPGGILAGHDYNKDACPGLVRAVHETLGTVEFVAPTSWRTRV
jgi:cephalosporin hydroxylase